MDVAATWKGGLAFAGIAESGFSVAMDASEDVGGGGAGLRPTELVALGLAGCTGMDVIAILRKKRQDVREMTVRVHVEQADEHPRVFIRIAIEYAVSGRGIDPAAVARAIELSSTKYCPVEAMLRKTAEVTTQYTIREIGDGGSEIEDR